MRESTSIEDWIGRLVATRICPLLHYSPHPDEPWRFRSLAASLVCRGLCQHFCKAHEYACNAVYDRNALAEYQRLATLSGRPAYAIARQDYCTPPWVEFICMGGSMAEPGDCIFAYVGDDVGVVCVTVELFDENGFLIEGGPAEPIEEEPEHSWAYVTLCSIDALRLTVRATAFDHVGNAAAHLATFTRECAGEEWDDCIL